MLALGKLGNRSKIDFFRKAMNAEKPILIASAYLALAHLGEVNILPTLLEKIKAPESSTLIRTKSAEALTILKPHLLKLVQDNFKQDENLGDISLLDSLQFSYQVNGSNLILIFTQALTDSKSPLNQDAPLVLNELKERIALPALREALFAENPELAATAAYVLGEFKDEDAFSYLVKVFEQYGI